MPNQLWKTTIVIWTDYDPSLREIDHLASEAMVGDAYCSEQKVEVVTDKDDMPDTSFFGCEED